MLLLEQTGEQVASIHLTYLSDKDFSLARRKPCYEKT